MMVHNPAVVAPWWGLLLIVLGECLVSEFCQLHLWAENQSIINSNPSPDPLLDSIQFTIGLQQVWTTSSKELFIATGVNGHFFLKRGKSYSKTRRLSNICSFIQTYIFKLLSVFLIYISYRSIKHFFSSCFQSWGNTCDAFLNPLWFLCAFNLIIYFSLSCFFSHTLLYITK